MQKETLPTSTSLYGSVRKTACGVMPVQNADGVKVSFFFSGLKARFCSHLNLCKPKWIPVPSVSPAVTQTPVNLM